MYSGFYLLFALLPDHLTDAFGEHTRDKYCSKLWRAAVLRIHGRGGKRETILLQNSLHRTTFLISPGHFLEKVMRPLKINSSFYQ